MLSERQKWPVFEVLALTREYGCQTAFALYIVNAHASGAPSGDRPCFKT
ncbi:MAG: hypothetical protein LBV27_10130 [Oscillospiraceae bacterium]|jgi:hypothetical protein|nr:hypothetical protein [Oscillospiraceae bacterium]